MAVIVRLSHLRSSSIWVSETTRRTDNAPLFPTRAARTIWVNTQEGAGENEMALLASALKNNVANVETQAQSMNLSHHHESTGMGQFLPSTHPLAPLPLLQPLRLCFNCWISERCFLFGSEQRENERHKNAKRCKPV